MLATLAEMARATGGGRWSGVDGCGVPVTAVPLAGLAARFRAAGRTRAAGRPPDGGGTSHLRGDDDHPALIGGSGRFDTLLVEAGGGTG